VEHKGCRQYELKTVCLDRKSDFFLEEISIFVESGNTFGTLVAVVSGNDFVWQFDNLDRSLELFFVSASLPYLLKKVRSDSSKGLSGARPPSQSDILDWAEIERDLISWYEQIQETFGSDYSTLMKRDLEVLSRRRLSPETCAILQDIYGYSYRDALPLLKKYNSTSLIPVVKSVQNAIKAEIMGGFSD